MIVDFLDYLRGRLRSLAKIGIGILILLPCIDILVIDKRHAHVAIEHFPAFWSIFGFVVAAVIIIVAKWFGRQGIRQKEDYYD
ncbi:MAG: hypothetical protein GXP59_07280 [Deltaproteobacteria bacterium]|nr:hypothetical protein [Deltaproteobacteria bacterium]